MNGLSRLIGYTKNHKTKIVLVVLFNALAAIFSTISIAMLWPFLSILFGQVEPILEAPTWSLSIDGIVNTFKYRFFNYVEEVGQIQALSSICLGIVVVFFLKNLFRYLAMVAMTPLRNGIIYDLRKRLYDKVLNLPVSFYTEQRKGDLLSRMSTDVHEIEWSILNVIEVIFKEPLLIFFALFAMIKMNWQLTLIVFGLLLFTVLIIGSIGKALKKKSTEAQARMGNLLSIIEESISGMRIIQSFNASKTQAARFDNENNAYRNTMNRLLWRRDLSSPMSEFLGIGIFVFLLWVGSKMVFTGEMEPSTLFLFLAFFYQIINPAKAFSKAYYNIQKGLAASERLEQIFEVDEEIKNKPNPITLEKVNEGIEFRNVSFSYDQTHLVLNQVNFSLAKGKVLALVGASGAGKTTLVDLLPRFYDPTEGSIFIDGKNIQDIDLKSLRNLFGIVTQNPILFHDTIYNNIAFGMPNASKEQVINAAKNAYAHDFIMESPLGYETKIGDQGLKLSGGQRQRLTIARAILKNPPILILDEATSALDSESEKWVQDALAKLMQTRTSIVIAHRLSTIQHADEILVMHDGIIIERGNHKELLELGASYASLVKLQAF